MFLYKFVICLEAWSFVRIVSDKNNKYNYLLYECMLGVNKNIDNSMYKMTRNNGSMSYLLLLF